MAAELEKNRLYLQGLDSSISIENFAYPYGTGSVLRKRQLGKAGLVVSLGEPVQGALSKAEVLAAPIARADRTSSSQSGRISGTEDRSNSV